MQKRTLGIFAHVDAGKTTLSENLLHHTGALRQAGRVDHQNTLLDSDALERRRGITIYSGVAAFSYQGQDFYLLDTPGHVDFSAEMERALAVVDGAILLISASSGVQSHTITLHKLLRERNIPTYAFINKMDLPGADIDRCLRDIRDRLGRAPLHLPSGLDLAQESLIEALCEYDDALMERYLEGTLKEEQALRSLQKSIASQKFLPVIAGSALQNQGIEELLAFIEKTLLIEEKQDPFAARVFKTIFDKKGHAVTMIKCLSGTLQVKQELPSGKAHELRAYQGESYQQLDRALAGDIVGVTGLSGLLAGMGLGACPDLPAPRLQPALRTAVLAPDSALDATMNALRRLEAQDPLLQVRYNESLRQIELLVMGRIQLEVLEETLRAQGLDLRFGKAAVLYRETIGRSIMGYGHYEPLRHYAEVHLRLEPHPGGGITFASEYPLDNLPLAYQNQVRHTLLQDLPPGTLTGSPLEDIRFVLTAGAIHLKHTEGGDLREATRRAVRQALEKAENILLEPYYRLSIDVDTAHIGRVMADIIRLHGEFSAPESHGERSRLEATGPLETLMEYPSEMLSFTKGSGAVSVALEGYRSAHDPERIIAALDYDPIRDTQNPSSSVFCAKGAGFEVKSRHAEEWMHLPLHSHPAL